MNRHLRGLNGSAEPDEIVDGVYLVRVQRAQYRWHKRKPFYEFNFYVLEPAALRGGDIAARLYCAPKQLWKFGWFLRDFRYNQELLDRDEIDLRALIGLEGVIQVGHETKSGQSQAVLYAFAPAPDWERLAPPEAASA